MEKSRAVSVWLLKSGFDATNSLVSSHKLDGPIHATELPTGASLYLNDPDAQPPWWRSYFGISQPLTQGLKAAVVFVPVEARVFVITFGNASHNLRPESYEHDFGLLVTLNCVDPLKLRNTDTADPGAARRQRTQTAVGSDITYFDIERDTHVLRSLTGAAKAEYHDRFHSVTGSAQVRFNTTADADELPTVCEELLQLYGKDDYKSTFPDLRNVRPVRDPTLVAALDEKLLVALRSKSVDPELALPELIDYDRARYVRLSAGGPGDLFEDLELPVYYSHLKSKGVSRKKLTIDELASHRVLVLDENEDVVTTFSLKRCVVFDTKLEGRSEHFHLMDGSWFALEPSYVKRLRRELAPLFVDTGLPAMTSGAEADYNVALAAHLGGACLDKTNVSPADMTQVEPCDVASVSGSGTAVLTHVKIGTGAADMSHLFYQGQNGTTLVLTDDEAGGKLNGLITKLAPTSQISSALLAALKADQPQVSYVVITRKDPTRGLKNLPLFSQLSLSRAARTFKGMRVPVTVTFVADQRPVAPPKAKTRKKPTGKAPVFS